MNAKATLLVCGQILTLDRNNTVIEDGAVAIAGDTILEVGERAALVAKYPGVAQLTQPHGLVMPGLVNTHTHAAMGCFLGLADDLPLMTWLTEYIFPVEANLNGEMVYQSSLLSMAEMIKSGTTSFCDMYLFAKEVARATADSGMRGWLGEVLYDFPSPNYGVPENGIAYLEELLAEYRTHPLISITVDPHAVYTCSPDLLKRLKGVAEKHGVAYVIHLSETRDEVKACLAKYGKTPVMHLDSLGLLDSQVVANHCVVLSEQEIDLLAERGVKVAHCPESNMKLASGVAPVVEMLAAGVIVGLGTDGAASNNDVDMFGEMDTAAKLHKVHRHDPTVMSAETTLRMATQGGAQLLGAETLIGSLEPGKKADLIVLDMNKPHLTPMYNIPSHLVYAAKGSDVVHSVINGLVVMRDKQLLTMDEDAVLDRLREIGAQISGMVGPGRR
ncbi:amidohydrolase family protein [Thiovibrio frasassiensis]|uniref:5-methylthioadenosine/S-adenosylhomocysteine deaminase n=1 Tax=Thiovibrio frasassiensis TaxID=2984131 RepID=A0A9X4RMV2_9BACT|nr:amidohydrolase [Thiovibrio frasassiensis]MDG4476630.1 amidohydrolase [Thiovibrio frasassiensis]